MSEKRLTPLEEEFLLDMFIVQEQFQASQIPAGTIRSKVMFRMASRRGKTRPAPVHGLSEADRSFKSTFTRTVNRLLKKDLIHRRKVGLGDFHGLPYQWGYGRHGKRDSDIFLTDEGMAIAQRLQIERRKEGRVEPPIRLPVKAVTQSEQPAKPQNERPAKPQDERPRHGRQAKALLGSRLLYAYTPSPGVRYNVTLPVGEHGFRPVLYRHAVKMKGFEVIYEVVGKAKKGLPTDTGK
jgi:hypothetical protein